MQAGLYCQLGPVVMGMAQRILQDRGLAQEVVQDTFVELLEKAEEIRSEQSLVAWVRRVAVNNCLMRLRSGWYRYRLFNPEPAITWAVDPASDSSRQAALRDLERALGSLPATTRMVLWLHDVEGYTHREIAALMGKTPSFSKSQLSRGHRKLRGRVGEAKVSEINTLTEPA